MDTLNDSKKGILVLPANAKHICIVMYLSPLIRF